jgi:uncharacterized protein
MFWYLVDTVFARTKPKRGGAMERTRWGTAIGVVSLVIVLVWAKPALASQELVPMITPPAGGGAYVLGAGIASVTNKYMGGNIKFVHESSTGTLEMVRRFIIAEQQKKPAFALFGANDAYNAYKGTHEYAGKPFPGLRAVSFNQQFELYLAVPAGSPIKSYADLKGKRVGMGGPGSTVSTTAHLLLDQYGVAKKDFKPYYYVYKETVEGISDGSLDAGFLAGVNPVASYLELSTTKNVRIVPVDEKIADRIVAENPGYFKGIDKAKSYKGLEQDTRIVGWAGGFWTHAGVSNELVYNVLKNLFDHIDDYYAVHASAKVLTRDTATLAIFVPFHPGAEKYLKEIGAMK